MLYNVIVISFGLLISVMLFYKFPVLKRSTGAQLPFKISVIIPARNEEKNLGLLLQDLKCQNTTIYEIICVDDGSTDATASVANSFGVKLIDIKNKPKDWTGKAWACQKGAQGATGDLFLFLDADVRLTPYAISNLMNAYNNEECVISVQPYHQTVKNYEQFSLFFNIIQIAANGMCVFFKTKNAGLYGPVILMSKDTYTAIGGHICAKNSIVDDLALGEKLIQMGFAFKLFMGGKDISFRMYGSNFKSLFLGWTKNYATGALKTPFRLFLMVFLWITSCTSVIISLIQSVAERNLLYIAICTVLYILWILELNRISRNIGSFKKYVLLGYPIYLALFIWVFIVSFIKKLFHRNVLWKDRKIKLEK